MQILNALIDNVQELNQLFDQVVRRRLSQAVNVGTVIPTARRAIGDQVVDVEVHRIFGERFMTRLYDTDQIPEASCGAMPAFYQRTPSHRELTPAPQLFPQTPMQTPSWLQPQKSLLAPMVSADQVVSGPKLVSRSAAEILDSARKMYSDRAASAQQRLETLRQALQDLDPREDLVHQPTFLPHTGSSEQDSNIHEKLQGIWARNFKQSQPRIVYTESRQQKVIAPWQKQVPKHRAVRTAKWIHAYNMKTKDLHKLQRKSSPASKKSEPKALKKSITTADILSAPKHSLACSTAFSTAVPSTLKSIPTASPPVATQIQSFANNMRALRTKSSVNSTAFVPTSSGMVHTSRVGHSLRAATERMPEATLVPSMRPSSLMTEPSVMTTLSKRATEDTNVKADKTVVSSHRPQESFHHRRDMRDSSDLNTTGMWNQLDAVPPFCAQHDWCMPWYPRHRSNYRLLPCPVKPKVGTVHHREPSVVTKSIPTRRLLPAAPIYSRRTRAPLPKRSCIDTEPKLIKEPLEHQPRALITRSSPRPVCKDIFPTQSAAVEIDVIYQSLIGDLLSDVFRRRSIPHTSLRDIAALAPQQLLRGSWKEVVSEGHVRARVDSTHDSSFFHEESSWRGVDEYRGGRMYYLSQKGQDVFDSVAFFSPMRIYHVSPVRAGTLGASNSANQLIACVMVPRILSHGPSENVVACCGPSVQISVQMLDKLMSVSSAPLGGICIFGATKDEYAIGPWGPQLVSDSQSQRSSALLTRRRLFLGSRSAIRASMQVSDEQGEASSARGVAQSVYDLASIDASSFWDIARLIRGVADRQR